MLKRHIHFSVWEKNMHLKLGVYILMTFFNKVGYSVLNTASSL